MNNELTAALLTIEKCRELSGCPAGVDLQDWVKQLAEENAGLKQQEPKAWYIRMTDEVTTDSGEAKMWLGVPLVLAGIETPATDRIVAEAEARGIEKGIAHLENKFSNIGVQIMNLQWLADSLREGDDK
ncbi:hypothetical protein [Klebsiella aerogenes]|uniref:hypothetical protein n=1 Tax=Klebsiella aerogenes TaxID=548 RepID=UPI00397C6E11